MYLSAVSRRRRGLRGLSGQAFPLSLAMVQPSAPAPNCPWWLWLTGNYLACTQQPQLIADANAQIQSVPLNAQAYGYAPNVVQVAQDVAAQQMVNTPADVTGATATVENSQVSQSPLTAFGNWALNPNVNATGSNDIWGLPWWAWIGIGIGGLVIVKALK